MTRDNQLGIMFAFIKEKIMPKVKKDLFKVAFKELELKVHHHFNEVNSLKGAIEDERKKLRGVVWTAENKRDWLKFKLAVKKEILEHRLSLAGMFLQEMNQDHLFSRITHLKKLNERITEAKLNELDSLGDGEVLKTVPQFVNIEKQLKRQADKELMRKNREQREALKKEREQLAKDKIKGTEEHLHKVLQGL